MAAKAKPKFSKDIDIDLGDLNPKQATFCRAKSRYVAYGGARGGGKTHVSRIKALGSAVKHEGIRILFIRREYPELEQTVIIPLKKMIPEEIAHYNGSIHMFSFTNGSIIKFGHFGPGDEEEYQGQEWDYIFMDEATQFTEEQFLILGACLRGATKIERHLFLTCNPGGIGHMWVKRLFVDREYRPGENPKDYTFIPATVDDNPQLLEGSPEYKHQLEILPEHKRRAWLLGDWDALAGTYFPEFNRETHVVPATGPQKGWQLYRALDYGLDMLACLWVGIDYDGKAHVYRELGVSGLIVKDAAKMILDKTPAGENIVCNFAPTDLWSKQKDTGKTMAEIFATNGLPLIPASRERIHGWQDVKDWLSLDMETGEPGMTVTEDCKELIRCMENIQHDEKNPDDCATIPHDITHFPDALRYFAISRTFAAEKPKEDEIDDDLIQGAENYDDYMTGGDVGLDYLDFGMGGY